MTIPVLRFPLRLDALLMYNYPDSRGRWSMERTPRETLMADDRLDQEVRVPYVTPSITTLSEEQILEEIGPARAYTGTLPFNF